jgi:hypothetical protein
MRDLDQETARRPDDPGPWLELVGLAQRNRQPLPDWAPRRLGLERLRAFWMEAPEDRAWLRYFAPLTGLRPAPRGKGRPGRYWVESGRRREVDGRAYDAVTGLPLIAIRHLDGAPMRLVPVEALEATLRGAARMGLVSTMFELGRLPIQAFYLDVVPVTLGRYLEAEEAWSGAGQARSLARTVGAQGVRPRCPVVLVTHQHAVDYTRWVRADLPRLFEWRAAACGVDQTTYPWGEEPPSPRLANYDPIEDRTRSRSLVRLPRGEERLAECLQQVGTYPDGAGPFGHLDLVGTVKEWMGPEPQGCIESGPWETVAGGGWLTPRGRGLAGRAMMHHRSDEEYVDVGFRCVVRL